jgi:hypothetical protein
MDDQGWDLARWTCGGCGFSVETTEEESLIQMIQGHKSQCEAGLGVTPLLYRPDLATFSQGES